MTTQTTTRNGDLFHEALIRSYIDSPRFVQRTWLWQRVQAALDRPHCRFVLLTAEPGAGKTAFMAWLAGQHPDWPRYFIRRDQRTALEDGGARGFLEKIGFQLAARFPEVFHADAVRLSVSQAVDTSSGQVTGAEIDRLVASPFYTKAIDIIQEVKANQGHVIGLHVRELVTDPNRISLLDLQRMALLAPAMALQRLGRSEPLVVMIDALDELRYRTLGDTVLDWLTQSPELPANVRILVTSRPEPEWLAAFRSAQQARLVEETIPQVGEDIRRDLTEYASKLVAIPTIESFLVVHEQPAQVTQGARELFVANAVEKAKGNLGYLDAVGRAIDQALVSNDQALLEGLLELKQLPDTLQDLYGHFLKLLRQSVGDQSVVVEDPVSHVQALVNAWTYVYRPVLGVLAVAMEPLTPVQIRRLGRMLAGDDDVLEAIGRLRQFLDEREGRYTFYHATLPEFLAAETIRQNPQYREMVVDPAMWHKRIVASYRGQAATWDQVDWRAVDDYGLSHLAGHLYALRDDPEDREELYELIRWPLMEAKGVRMGSARSFANDVNLAFQMAAAQEPPNWPRLVRYSFLHATLRSLVANVPPQMLALLAQAGRVRQAEDHAALIRDPEQQSETYQLISAVLLATGDLEQAVAAAQRITVAWRRAITLIPLLDRTNLHTTRGELVTQVLIEGAPDGQEPPFSDRLQALADTLARSGDIEQLNRVVARLSNERQRSVVLQKAIRILGHARSLPSRDQMSSWMNALEYDQNKAEVFTAFVLALVCQNDSEAVQQALEWSTTLGLKGQKVRIVAALASHVATHGNLAQLEQLQALVQQIYDDHARVHALSALARAAAQMGDRSRVSDLVPEIVALGERTAGDDPAAIASFQSNIAETFAAISAESEAKRAIEQALMAAHRTRFAPPFGVTGNELLDLALLLAQTRAVDSALALAEFGPAPVDRAYVRGRIAAVLADTGETKRAQALAEDVESFARDIRDPTARVILLGWVLHSQLRLGNREKAAALVDIVLRSIQLIEDPTTRARLLGEASSFLAQLDDPNRARDIAMQAAAEAEAIEDIAAKINVLSHLAVTSLPAVRQSLVHRTVQLADEIRGRASQISNLNQIVEALAQIGLTDHALEIVSTTGDAPRARILLISIMKGVRSQESAIVRKVALRCGVIARDRLTAGDRALALEFVARTLLAAEAYEEALAVAEMIEHPDVVPQAFAQIALALAQTEDKERAANLASHARQTLTLSRGAHIHARVLCDVALTYARLGQTTQAFDAIAQAEAILAASGSGGGPSDTTRTRELIRIADTLYLMDEPRKSAEAAQHAIQMVTFNGRIAYGLAPVVRALVLLGDYDAAMELLTTIEGPARPGGFSLSIIIKPLLQMGKFNETLTLTERAGIDGEGGYVLPDIAEALSKAPVETSTTRYAIQLLRLAKLLKQGWVKARTLVEIAFVLAVAEEGKRPKALARKALAVFKTDRDASFKRDVVKRVAEVCGRVGDRDGLELALASAAALKDTQDRTKAQIAIAQAFLSIGAAERTIEIASRAIEFTRVEGDQHFYAQARTLSTMGQILADLGEPEQALALVQRAVAAAKAIRYYAGQSGGKVDKDGALAAVAQAGAQTSAIDEALSIAERIIYKLDQVCILRKATSGFMQAGSWTRARRVAKQAKTIALEHEETLLKAYMLCAAAEALATIGEGTGVKTMLRQVHDMEPLFENMANKAQVWSVVSQVFAQIGDEKRAVNAAQAAWDAAHSRLHRWDRIWALLSVGGAMAAVGMGHEAASAAEQALMELDERNHPSEEEISRNFHFRPVTRFNTTCARIAFGMPWRSELAVLLVATHVFLNAKHRQQAAATAERALASARAIKPDAQRLIALSLVSGTMTAIGQQEKALASLFTALELAYKSDRQQVLEVLWGGAMTIAAIDQGNQLRETAAAIVEIVDRWPPEARTLKQATDQGGTWAAVIGVAGQRKFE